jgi:hypothetical protein
MKVSRRVFLSGAAAAGLSGGPALAELLAETFTLKHPDGRETAYRVMAPSAGGDWPVILFSHGANSSYLDYDRLWRPWAQAGYLVVGPNHIDNGPPETQRKVGRDELWAARLADTTLPLRQKAPFEAFARRRAGAARWETIAVARRGADAGRPGLPDLLAARPSGGVHSPRRMGRRERAKPPSDRRRRHPARLRQ